MFGYVRPSRRIGKEEQERFRAMYCGLCHTLGRRFGFPARFLLNFDFTLLAILLSEAEAPVCCDCRCVAHPFRCRRAAEQSQALDRAAERSVILAWWQLQDHIADHGRFGALRYRAFAGIFRGTYQKARAAAPDFDALAERRLGELAALEHGGCASIDRAAEPFAALLAGIGDCVEEAQRRRVLAELFYHLGRWIYLVDAIDDLADDARSGSYNPLRARYGVDTLSAQEKALLAQTLDASIIRMAGAYALLDAGIWTPILDSIFYESLYAIGNAVLNGTYRRALRLRGEPRKKNEETL